MGEELNQLWQLLFKSKLNLVIDFTNVTAIIVRIYIKYILNFVLRKIFGGKRMFGGGCPPGPL